jgi:hypothetical protein
MLTDFMMAVIRGQTDTVKLADKAEHWKRDQFGNTPLLLLAILFESKMHEFFSWQDIEQYKVIFIYLLDTPELLYIPNHSGLTAHRIILSYRDVDVCRKEIVNIAKVTFIFHF